MPWRWRSPAHVDLAVARVALLGVKHPAVVVVHRHHVPEEDEEGEHAHGDADLDENFLQVPGLEPKTALQWRWNSVGTALKRRWANGTDTVSGVLKSLLAFAGATHALGIERCARLP
jgi:hypothetical protein